jgi:hypothetical protein
MQITRSSYTGTVKAGMCSADTTGNSTW